MEKKEILEKALRNRNLKATSKRVELLSLISDYKSAIPYSEIQKKLHHFDRVTLYRTIKALLDGCIIHKASVSSDEVYYAICKEYCSSECHNHKHVHFKCVQCLEVSCVDVLDPVQIQIPNVTIQQIDIQVSGLCSNCT